MNAERLHVIARAIRNEMEELHLIENLQQLSSSLQNQVSTPQQPAHQKAVSEKLRELNEILAKAPSNRFSPAWRQVLREIEAEALLGSHLATRLREVFERNQITVVTASEEIQAIHQEADRLKSAIDQVTDAFTALHVSPQDLEPGQCEVGFLMPRKAVDNKLDQFAKELDEFNFILVTFSELITTKRESFDIRSVSSTDLTIYMEVMPPIAACVAVAVERLIKAYKTLLEIRKLQTNLREEGVPAERLEGIENHAKSVMESEIEKLGGEIIEEYCDAQGGRRNELKNALRITLNKLANRIDLGYNIEIRVAALEPPKEEEQLTEEEEATRRHVATILDRAEVLEFMSLEGKPILGLPESEEKGKKGGDKTGKKS